MTEHALHPQPRPGRVAGEQFRAVGTALRREGIAFAAVLGAATLVYGWAYVRAIGDPNHNARVGFAPYVAVPLALLALLAPMAVWKGEEPSRRSYLWALPVDRARHTLLKAFFGWVWMECALAAFMAWGLVFPLVSGGQIGLGDKGVPVEPWRWAVPFAAVTVLYVLGTVVVLLTDHPWRWMAGLLLAYGILGSLTAPLGLDGLGRGLWSLWAGPYGLETVLTGQVREVREMMSSSGRMLTRTVSVADAGAWLSATAIWLGVGLAATLAAVRRHQEA